MEILKINGITDDSRKVKSGYLFVAIKGLRVDGHKFIPQAIKKGARVVVGEENLQLSGVTYIKVDNSRRTLSLLASAWHRNPSQKLKIIGVTGTDGKTTTANLIYWILKKAGKKVGLVSTVSAKIGDRQYDTGFHVTNPEPLALYEFLAKMVEENCEYAVLEVTSHGLDQERVAGIKFDIGVLTNITHEHLDYHKTFRAYRRAKLKLFQNAKIAILNKDDENSNWIKKNIDSKVIFYQKDSLAKQRFPEPYNQENATAAIMVARLLKVPQKDIARALESFPGVEGRLQEVKNRRGIKIIIDYAHTPNGLKSVLAALSKKKEGKLIALIACEGERDRKKRPMMAEIAGQLVDTTILNAIDIRSEKAQDIVSDMEVGIKKTKGKYFKITDRGKAIDFAINRLAQKADTVVVCGKGHEKGMAYAGDERPWSDLEVINRVLKEKKKVAVLGLGLEGKDLVKFLLKKKLEVTVLDEKPESELDFTGINKEKIFVISGQDYLTHLKKFNIVFRSPGVYRYKKELIAAEKDGVEISSAVKLFFRECPAKIIGVTGTKGKGTTSTLIYEILKESGKDVYLAGNIGKPYLELLPKLTSKSWVIMELSSFQLIDLDKSPHIAVVLNITSDHMDWHKDQKEYVEAKKNIVKFQKPEDYAAINKAYKTPLGFAKATKAQKHFFTKFKTSRKILLRGEHNLENIAAAISASKLAGANKKVIQKIVFNFKGLEHRLELVKKVNDVTFYNDSFATGPQPTLAALASFQEPITVILGGFDKGLEYKKLAGYMAKTKNVGTAILIGDLAPKIERELKKAGYKGGLVNLDKSPMQKIVQTANEKTPKGGVVILSPAAASFDMFKDYKERGLKFKQAVEKLDR